MTAPLALNIACHLPAIARQQPMQLAVACPIKTDSEGRSTYSQLTFRELDQLSDDAARGLLNIGIARGVRTVLMVRPSLEFFVLTFALFKAGAVPVVVDPGIGLPALKRCLAQARPTAFIGIPQAHIARVVLGWARDTIATTVTTGSLKLFAQHTLRELIASGHRSAAPVSPVLADTRAHETAAILFTSGSTGPPKGVVYSHANFMAQIEALRDEYNIAPGEVDLCTFPLFALFAPALGMTSIIPEMDPTRPALVAPRNVITPIHEFAVTNLFGSPALINRVGRFGKDHVIKLPSLKRATSAGAPVPADVIERFITMLPPGAQLFTPYGATESLPVASIGSDELLRDTRQLTDSGHGVCIGRPVGKARVHVIRISDEPIATWSDDLKVTQGTIGEITVEGPAVTSHYFELPKLTALAKILREPGARLPDSQLDGQTAPPAMLHRMGDLGYFDDQGRLWFVGRKSHRVITNASPEGVMHSVPVEAIFNTHPAVFRSALVGVTLSGNITPVICIEREKANSASEQDLTRELLALAARFPRTAMIRHVLFHPAFPVDIRHNSKIGREKLAVWASTKLKS